MKEKNKEFEALVLDAIAYAKSLGATDAVAEISESSGLSVGVRQRQVETVERTRDRGMGITVYQGQRRGSASTSDLSAEAIQETVKAALNIARYTAEDEAAGLPEKELLATQFDDLELHHPWAISSDEAVDLALQIEASALDFSDQVSNSEGAQVDTAQGRFILANSLGFLGGYASTRHIVSASVIAGQAEQMQRDYWYDSNRYADRLMAPQDLGQKAAERALARLGARRLSTGKYPVLFEAPLAAGLIGHLLQAISGGAIYRQSSFLNQDSVGQTIMAEHLTLHEDPFIKGAMGSSMFDQEGVKTLKRDLITDGVLQGLMLSSYTARKLGMQSTGNAGGAHNLFLTSELTQEQDDFNAMLKKMGTGLVVTELIGQGVNLVTGDYSRGAFGYWVENGEIQYPVQEITIAGNLKEMFQHIVAVGNDVLVSGARSTGSILIEQMSVAGTK